MRFCMATTFYPPLSYGGDATFVRALSRSLVALGHQVDVIASTDAFAVRSGRPREPVVEQDDGVRVHRLHHPLGVAAALVSQQSGRAGLYGGVLRRLLTGPYDVLHFHNVSLLGAPAVLSMGNARTRLYTLHEHWLVCPTHILWKNRREACTRATCLSCSLRSGIPPQLWRYTGFRDRQLASIDRIFAPSAFTAERHRLGGISRPITVLPLFSSLEPGCEGAGLPGRPTIVFVGRVTASKGVEQLVRVAALLPQIDCVIVGDGDLRALLAARYSTCSNIRFTGPLPQAELVRHYRAAHALVLPSVAPETFGLTVVEAAACGTPAIVSAGSGGAAEIVRNTGGGLVYDGDAALCAAIRRLAAADDGESARLGLIARRGYERCYTRERHLGTYLDEIGAALENA